jgi:hypothetical protein
MKNPTPMTDERARCLNCRFYHTSPETSPPPSVGGTHIEPHMVGECRRAPPHTGLFSKHAVWPLVLGTHWCGEWRNA